MARVRKGRGGNVGLFEGHVDLNLPNCRVLAGVKHKVHEVPPASSELLEVDVTIPTCRARLGAQGPENVGIGIDLFRDAFLEVDFILHAPGG